MVRVSQNLEKAQNHISKAVAFIKKAIMSTRAGEYDREIFNEIIKNLDDQKQSIDNIRDWFSEHYSKKYLEN